MSDEVLLECAGAPTDDVLVVAPGGGGSTLDELERAIAPAGSNAKPTPPAAHARPSEVERALPREPRTVRMDSAEWIDAVTKLIPLMVGKQTPTTPMREFAILVARVLDAPTTSLAQEAARDAEAAAASLQHVLELSDAARAQQLAAERDRIMVPLRAWAVDLRTSCAHLCKDLRETARRVRELGSGLQQSLSALRREAAVLRGLTSGLDLGPHQQIWEQRIAEIVESELNAAFERVNEGACGAVASARRPLARGLDCSIRCTNEPCNEALVARCATAATRAAFLATVDELARALEASHDVLATQ